MQLLYDFNQIVSIFCNFQWGIFIGKSHDPTCKLEKNTDQ